MLLYQDIEISQSTINKLRNGFDEFIYIEIKDYDYEKKEGTNLYSKNYKCDIFFKTPNAKIYSRSTDSYKDIFLVGKCDSSFNITEKYTDREVSLDNHPTTCNCVRKPRVWYVLKNREDDTTSLSCNSCVPFGKLGINKVIDSIKEIVSEDIKQYSNVPVKYILSEMLNTNYDECKDNDEKKSKTVECWNSLLKKNGVVQLHPDCDIIIKTLLNVPEETSSKFYNSLKTLVKKEFIAYKELNIFTYIRQIKENMLSNKSEFVGSIDEVLEHKKVKLLNKVEKFGQYGQYYIFTFEDDNGNILKSFYSRDIGDINNRFLAKFKVLEHSEYNGVKQTKIKLLRIGEWMTND